MAATAPILFLFLAHARRRPLAGHPFPHHREPNLPSPRDRLSLFLSLSLSLSPRRRYKRRWTRWSIPPLLAFLRAPSWLPADERSLPCILRLRCAVAVPPRLTPPSTNRRPPPTRSPSPRSAACRSWDSEMLSSSDSCVCAIYPFVRRAVPSPHPLPASRSPASTTACASAAIKG